MNVFTSTARFISRRRHDFPAVRESVVNFGNDALDAIQKGWEEGKKQPKKEKENENTEQNRKDS